MHSINFNIANIQKNAFGLTAVSWLLMLARYAKENENINPLAKTMKPETAKQKYVNPEMNIKNTWERSTSENLIIFTKRSENVS